MILKPSRVADASANTWFRLASPPDGRSSACLPQLPAVAPPTKMKADAGQPGSDAGKGVTDTVLAAIDLEKD